MNYKSGPLQVVIMAQNILASSHEQSTVNFTPDQSLYQEDLNAIAHSASDIVDLFPSDSDIGRSYANLARAASETSKALERLAAYAEERRTSKGYA